MNTQLLTEKTAELVSLLNTFASEARDISASRDMLEKKELVNSEREERLNNEKIALAQREKDLDSQKAYIDEMRKVQEEAQKTA